MSASRIEEGRAALREGDAATARRKFELALAEVESGEVLEGLGEALYLEREYAAAAAHYERAYSAYRRERDNLAAGRVARMVAWITGNVFGDWAVQSGWFARARTILEEAGDDRPERGWVLVIRSFSEPDAQVREALFREALAIGRRFGVPDVEFEALGYLGCQLILNDRVEEGMACLDKLLVNAASEAGAEVREGFTVEDLVVEDGRVSGIRGHGDGGRTVTEHARVVVGADGRHSLVARAVRPEQYNEKPQLLCGYYSYWSGLPMDGRFETYVRPDRGFAAWPTHDDLTLVIVGWPFAELEANRQDIEGNYLKTIEMAPAFAERVRAARREERFVGTAVPNFFRRPYGPGWALVGDAGYNRDFITAQGMHDAFRDAELCATALDEAFLAARPFEAAMEDYRSARDRQVLPMYEFTTMVATLEPPPPELQQLLAAAHGNQQAMDDFARVNAGVLSPAEFFSDENVAHILSQAAAAARS